MRIVLAGAAEEAHVELPIPAEAIGLLAIAALVGLLLFTYAFRGVGNRHGGGGH